MATLITDLDELLAPDKKVKIKGKTYVLPGDLPVELYLRINRAAEGQLTEPEMVKMLYSELLELFRYGDPKIESLPLGMGQLVNVIPTIYGPKDESAERPTTRTTRGASSAKTGRPSRTRSRS